MNYQQYHFSVKFIVSGNEPPGSFPFTVSVAATSHHQACKVAWKRIREEQRRLLNSGYTSVNTTEFKTILDDSAHLYMTLASAASITANEDLRSIFHATELLMKTQPEYTQEWVDTAQSIIMHRLPQFSEAVTFYGYCYRCGMQSGQGENGPVCCEYCYRPVCPECSFIVGYGYDMGALCCKDPGCMGCMDKPDDSYLLAEYIPGVDESLEGASN